MSEKVYKKVELVGCSPVSVEKAVEAAVSRAATSLHGLSWFEIKEIRGSIRDGKPSEWQVTLAAGFKLD